MEDFVNYFYDIYGDLICIFVILIDLNFLKLNDLIEKVCNFGRFEYFEREFI